MNSRLRVVTLAALASITIVAVASMAQGSDGQPLVIGTANTSLSDTTLTADGSANGLTATSSEYALEGTNTTGGEGAGVYGIGKNGAAGVQATGASGSDALYAEGPSVFNGDAAFLNGSVRFGDTSGVAVIPAGSDRVTVSVAAESFDRLTHGTAMLQQRRSSQVAAVRPDRAGHTVTIYLDKAVGLDTKVAWFLFD